MAEETFGMRKNSGEAESGMNDDGRIMTREAFGSTTWTHSVRY